MPPARRGDHTLQVRGRGNRGGRRSRRPRGAPRSSPRPRHALGEPSLFSSLTSCSQNNLIGIQHCYSPGDGKRVVW